MSYSYTEAMTVDELDAYIQSDEFSLIIPRPGSELSSAYQLMREKARVLEGIHKAAAKFRDAFTYDPGHSDLDREQPITITISLGDWRDLNYALNAAPQGRAGEGFLSTRNAGRREAPADAAPTGPNNDEYTNWLEDELMECMRLVSKGLYGPGQDEDEITDALRLHGIRLLVEADAEKYEAALDRWQKRHPERDATSRPVSTTEDQGG